MTGRNKIWRLAVTLPMTVILALLGWFAADMALTWYAGDPDYGPVIITRAPAWVASIIRFTYLSASAIFGIALGRLVFRWLESVDERLQKMSGRDKLALLGGLSIGLILSAIVSLPIIFSIPSRLISTTATLLLGVVITFVTTAAALSLKEEIRLYYPSNAPAVPEEKVPPRNYKLLDTNVIIDGRIADIARAGFVEGTLYIPGFVLDELQHIADSSDDLRRQRGKRGLDVLRLMQAEQTLEVREYDKLADDADTVDARLVSLAKAMNAAIVTNDSNLNKVARLEGVNVLNVNELANALKPVVLVGEDLPLTLVREGKEPSQGVGYLDDGTMVVVAGGRRYIGHTVRVQVTSVTQSTVGKMIFAQVREGSDNTEDKHADGDAARATTGDAAEDPVDDAFGPNGGNGSYERGMRPYSGRRSRRPVR